MFAMLSGRLPLPADAGDDPRAAVEAAVRLQLGAGLGLLTDGGVRWEDPFGAVLAELLGPDSGTDGMLVEAWRDTRAVVGALADERAGVEEERPAPSVAAVVPGPWSLAVRSGVPAAAPELAARLARDLRALAAAGCEIAVVEEPEATAIGADEEGRRSFRAAHAALLGDEPPLHAMLAITGGSAWEAGAETIVAAPYASYLLDLVGGPDNWYLARAAAPDRGIVCGALTAPSTDDETPMLVWAARYAASMGGRGLHRVGLANGSSLEGLSPDEAAEALRVVARGAELAALAPAEAVAEGLDRRTFAQPERRGAGQSRGAGRRPPRA